MAEERAVFSVELRDEMSGAAMQAAQALQALKSKMTDDVRALREMQQALARLRAGTTVNATAVNELKERIAAKKTEIANAQSRFLELGGTFGDVAKAAGRADADLGKLLGIAQNAGGPVGALARAVGSLGGLLSAGLAAGAVVAAAAVAGLTVALAAGYVALARYALGAAGARREELLHLEALTKIPNWYGIAAGKASDLQRAIDDVSGSSALGRADVAKYAEELYRMGLRGKSLATALDATAIKASTQGDQWARMFMGQAASSNVLGQSVDRLANRVKNQLGGIAKQQALSFDVQVRKLRENVARIFEGVKIGPFLEALNSVLRIFSQNEAVGRGLRTVIETMFKPLETFFTGSVALVAKRFFQGLVIGALLLTLRALDLRDAIRRVFGDKKILGDLDLATVALYAGVAAVGLFSAALGLLGLAFVSTAMALAPFVAAVVGLVSLGAALGFWISDLVNRAGALRAAFADTDWAAAASGAMAALGGGVTAGLDAVASAVSGAASAFAGLGSTIGRSLIDGLVGAIRVLGASQVVGAVSSLSDSIKAAFRSALGIASPSRVFAGYGRQIGAGVTVGIGASRRDVEDAVIAMAPMPPAGRRGGAAMGSRSVSVGAVNVYTSATDARGIAASIRDELAAVLEGVVVEMGAPNGLEPA